MTYNFLSFDRILVIVSALLYSVNSNAQLAPDSKFKADQVPLIEQMSVGDTVHYSYSSVGCFYVEKLAYSIYMEDEGKYQLIASESHKARYLSNKEMAMLTAFEKEIQTTPLTCTSVVIYRIRLNGINKEFKINPCANTGKNQSFAQFMEMVGEGG